MQTGEPHPLALASSPVRVRDSGAAVLVPRPAPPGRGRASAGKAQAGPLGVPVGVSVRAPPHVTSLLGVCEFNTLPLAHGSRHNPKGRIGTLHNRL